MKTYSTIHGITADFYEDSDDMPCDRYRLLQQAELERNGVGWTKQDHQAQLQSTYAWIARGDLKAAQTAMENCLMGFQALLQSVDLLSGSVACLLHSVNGVLVTATTHPALLEAYGPVAVGLSVLDAEELIETVKKKYSLS